MFVIESLHPKDIGLVCLSRLRTRDNLVWIIGSSPALRHNEYCRPIRTKLVNSKNSFSRMRGGKQKFHTSLNTLSVFVLKCLPIHYLIRAWKNKGVKIMSIEHGQVIFLFLQNHCGQWSVLFSARTVFLELECLRTFHAVVTLLWN